MAVGRYAVRCPACDSAEVVGFADLGQVPVLSGYTWATAQGAQAAPRGQMRLAYCPTCAHVVNLAFDERMMRYDGSYDNSLHHSPAFTRYAVELAEHLAKTYDLGGRTILELGCGKGEFLRLLCTAAGARGLGYDLAYDGPEEVDGVRFVRDYVTTADSPPPFDFLVSRHVLEHLVDPYAFLVGVRRHASDRAIRGYVEVPDARYDLGAAGWGCIYPHAGYFTGTSLSALLQRAGFEVQSIGTAFGGVFRYAEFATGPATKPHSGDLSGAREDIAAFTALNRRHRATVSFWTTRIREDVAAGRRVALWGAGARGVALLNAVDPGRSLTAVVDRNPAKHGRYLPCTGHQVTDPKDLIGQQVDTVLITNPIYQGEIREQLAALGVNATIWDVSTAHRPGTTGGLSASADK